MVDMTEEEWRRRQSQLDLQQYGDPLKNPDTQAALARVAAMPVTYNNGGHWSGTNVPISDQDVALGRNQASDRDVMGAGHYGVRGWANKHPLGVIGVLGGLTALGGLAGGGAAAAGGGGGGGAGGTAGLTGAGGGLGAAGTTGSGVAGLEGVTVTGTAGGGSGLGAGLGMAGGAGAIANMPSQEQILNQYHQEQQGQLAQQPAPSIGSSSGFDWKKALQQQQQGGQQQQGQQPGAMQQPGQKPSMIDRIRGGLGKVGENLFPIDQAYGMTPEQQKQARQAALMKMGLGMMAASNNGARFGDAASFGLGSAQTSLTGALQRGYENARQAREDQRQQQADKDAQDRYDAQQSHMLEREKVSDQRYQAEQDNKLNQQKIENDRAAQAAKDLAEYRKQIGGAAVTKANGGNASSEGVDLAATQYYQTGKMPAVGNNPTLRAQILARAAEIAKDSGDTNKEVVLRGQANQANASALTNLTKQKTAVSAYERTAQANADMALTLSDQADRTGVPVFNRWINAGRKEVAGDESIAKFNAANETFVNEYAKVVSGSTGNTPVSDSARQHAHEMLSTAMTKEQYKQVIAVLKMEMANRMQGFDQEELSLRTNLLGSPAKGAGDGWSIEEVQ
jgi:hypothetical protein